MLSCKLLIIISFQLISDYATILTKDDEMRSQLLQGVEKNRRDFPDFNKATLNKNI